MKKNPSDGDFDKNINVLACQSSRHLLLKCHKTSSPTELQVFMQVGSNHWRCSVKKKDVLKNFANFTGKRQAFRPVTLLKRYSNTGVLL